MQSSCAHHVPHYTAQRFAPARPRQACSRLTSRFRVAIRSTLCMPCATSKAAAYFVLALCHAPKIFLKRTLDVYLSLFASIAGFVLLSHSVERPHSLRSRLGRKVNYVNLVRKRLRHKAIVELWDTGTNRFGCRDEAYFDRLARHTAGLSDNTSAVRVS